MRTYDVAYMYEGVVMYRAKLKAANKYRAKTNARALVTILPLRYAPTDIRITLIKNKGDRK